VKINYNPPLGKGGEGGFFNENIVKILFSLKGYCKRFMLDL